MFIVCLTQCKRVWVKWQYIYILIGQRIPRSTCFRWCTEMNWFAAFSSPVQSTASCVFNLPPNTSAFDSSVNAVSFEVHMCICVDTILSWDSYSKFVFFMKAFICLIWDFPVLNTTLKLIRPWLAGSLNLSWRLQILWMNLWSANESLDRLQWKWKFFFFFHSCPRVLSSCCFSRAVYSWPFIISKNFIYIFPPSLKA